MRVVLKKDVNIKELEKYGFEHDIHDNVFKRPTRWLTREYGVQLEANAQTREVYYFVFRADKPNREIGKYDSTMLIPNVLLAIAHLLEIKENDNK